MSTNASKAIYQKKLNRPSYPPLTSDIQLFRDYLLKVQNYNISESKKMLLKLIDIYKKVYLAQLILLNRRRSEEVQRMYLEIYSCASTELSQKEFELSLSDVKRQLTKKIYNSCQRVKRGRNVPIMFTPNFQKVIESLLKIGQKTDFIDTNNPYLFALPHTF